MKIILSFYILVVILLFGSSFSLSENSESVVGELIIENKSTNNIKVVVYPIGAIFN